MPSLPSTEKLEALSRSPLFQALSHRHRERLAEKMHERSYSDGQTIFLRGDPGTSLLAVACGRVRIAVTSAEGRELVLVMLGPGDIFGEMSLVDGSPRSADATAVGVCVLLGLERRDLLAALRDSPEALLSLCRILCARIRDTTERLEAAMVLPLRARLARLVLSLAETEGEPVMGGGTRVVAPSQSDLGRLVGASRQKVNLHLRKWVADGMLGRDGSMLVIRDTSRLEGVAVGSAGP